MTEMARGSNNDRPGIELPPEWAVVNYVSRPLVGALLPAWSPPPEAAKRKLQMLTSSAGDLRHVS